MGARRWIAGFFALAAASLALATIGFGAPESDAPESAATPDTKATVAASPAAPVAPTAAPTILSTPRVEPSVGGSPRPAPTSTVNFPSVLRALVPFSTTSSAPTQTYAAFM